MDLPVLVGYATSYGSTKEVAEAVAAALREGGVRVDVRLARDVRALAPYGAVVLGAPLFMFRWHRDARGFLARHRKALAGMPAAVFALGPTHVPHDDAEWRNSRAQLENALSGFPWFAPAAVKVFGGKYDPASLRFPVRWLAGDVPASDIRDWASIRAWSEEMKSVLVAGFT